MFRQLQRLASPAPGRRALHGGAEEPAAEVVSEPGAELGRRAKEAGGGVARPKPGNPRLPG